MQSILIAHGFYICELAYLLELICNPKSTLMVLCWSSAHMHRVVENSSHPRCIFKSEVPWGHALPSCSSSHSVKKMVLLQSTQCHFSRVWAFSWWFHCFKGPPTVVHKCCLVFPWARRLWRALICALHKLFSGPSYSVTTVSSMFMNRQHILN